VARQAYLATIAARARGAAAVLVPPSVPMRGWDGAWPAELPPAAVVKPAMAASSPPLETTAVRARSVPAVLPELPRPGDPDAGAVTTAAGDRAGPSALRAHSWSPAEPAIAPDAREPLASIAHDASSSPRPPRVETSANPPLADRPVPRVENVASPAARAVAPSGIPGPLRAASQAERVADPEADRARSTSAPVTARLSPAAALHAAFQWVSSPPAAERSTSAVASEPARDTSRMAPTPRVEHPTAEHPTAERLIAGAGAHAAAARRDALPAVAAASERKPAPRTLHIGSIEVEIQTPRDGADRDTRPVQSAPAPPAAPLARGFTTPLGLRQG
jgi:hypothetical protein